MNHKICVCIDISMGLNDSLQNYNYSLPSPEESFAKLNDGKFFSKLDLLDSYLQILVEECLKLPTINTRKGILKNLTGRSWMRKRLQKSCQILTQDLEHCQWNWWSVEKLNLCLTRFYLNRRHEHQG